MELWAIGQNGLCGRVRMLSLRAMITKRQLGLILAGLGIAAIVGSLLMDLVGAGQFQGIGPAQQRILLVAALAILVGLSLLPLGDRPA